MSLQQFLKLADCRVGLTQWSRQIVAESGSSDLEGPVTEACVSARDHTGGDIRWASETSWQSSVEETPRNALQCILLEILININHHWVLRRSFFLHRQLRSVAWKLIPFYCLKSASFKPKASMWPKMTGWPTQFNSHPLLTNWVNIPAVLVAGPTATLNSPFSSLVMAITIAITHWAYIRRDGQAELAWVGGYI